MHNTMTSTVYTYIYSAKRGTRITLAWWRISLAKTTATTMSVRHSVMHQALHFTHATYVVCAGGGWTAMNWAATPLFIFNGRAISLSSIRPRSRTASSRSWMRRRALTSGVRSNATAKRTSLSVKQVRVSFFPVTHHQLVDDVRAKVMKESKLMLQTHGRRDAWSDFPLEYTSHSRYRARRGEMERFFLTCWQILMTCKFYQ